jgi:S1-C subfamily serine protease
MEQLTKQQLILLALLVSFVTSLATGIFTVSLMDQAPKGVVQTIHEVVEKMVTPQDAAVTASTPTISQEDKITSAAAQVTKSVVKLHSPGSTEIVGLGLIVSNQGVIMADKSVLAQMVGFEAQYPNGSHYALSVIQSQTQGDIVLLAPSAIASSTGLAGTFTPIDFGGAPKLGQTTLIVSGKGSPTLSQGIISQLDIDHINPDGSQPARIGTSVPVSAAILIGSPLFNTDGEVIGMTTSTVSKDATTAAFYPIMQLKGSIPRVR